MYGHRYNPVIFSAGAAKSIAGLIDQGQKTAIKYLTGDVTTTGVMTDLTFSNLVAARWYLALIKISTDGATGADTTVNIIHNSATIGTVDLVDQGSENFGKISHHLTLAFTASGTTLTFDNQSSTSPLLTVLGDGTASKTSVRLIEISPLTTTTDWD